MALDGTLSFPYCGLQGPALSAPLTLDSYLSTLYIIASFPLSFLCFSSPSRSFLLGLCVLCAQPPNPPVAAAFRSCGSWLRGPLYLGVLPWYQLPAISHMRSQSTLIKTVFQALTPWHKLEMIIFTYLFIGVLSILSGGGLVSVSLGHCCNPVTRSIPNVLHKHLRT